MRELTLHPDRQPVGPSCGRGAPPPRLGRGAAGTFAAAALLLRADGAAAQALGERADKGRFHLFRPTPPELMRELDTDRPDQTESPITVDAGHFQVEADLFSFSDSRRNGVRQTELNSPSLNLKVGLLNSVDLQLLLQPYNRVRIEDRSTVPGTVTTVSGFGDTQVRTKVNLWGNDEGQTALAVMPFVRLPTGARGLTSDAVEGGVIFPFNLDLPAGFALGAMWEVDWVRDADSHAYHSEFVQSLTLNRSLIGRLSAYVEFFSVVSTERRSDWLGTFDFGFNYLAHRNLKLDAGLNMGVTGDAPDWVSFVGVTWRY